MRGSVQDKLFVEVGGQGSIKDSILLTGVREGFKVRIVGKSDEELGSHLFGSSHLNGVDELSLNPEKAFKKFVNLALISVVGVREIVNFAILALGGKVNESFGDVIDVDGADAKTRGVEGLLLLASLFVN